MWVYGSGFPKSHDVSKAIDKAAGKRREVIGGVGFNRSGHRQSEYGFKPGTTKITAPATDAAREWAGWGTALKPAYEPIILARKPLDGTVAANVQKWGCGSINISACRVPSCKDAYSNDDKAPLRKDAHEKNRQSNRSQVLFEGQPDFDTPRSSNEYERENERQQSQCSRVDYPPSDRSDDGPVRLDKEGGQASSRQQGDAGELPDHLTKPRNNRECLSTYPDYTTLSVKSQGRWPANLLHDGSEEVLELFPETTSGKVKQGYLRNIDSPFCYGNGVQLTGFGDSGSAARFFYCAKASRAERTCGGAIVNGHPTIKPLALMRYLCRLVTPPGGTILDPFMGSGTTGMAAKAEGFEFIGIEREAEYIAIAEARIGAALEARP
jgi:hypothetical protein